MLPIARQTRLTTRYSRSSACQAKKSAMPPNSAASATRSSVESKKAPKVPVRPILRAIAPSMRSLNTKAVTTSTPCQSMPCGKNTSAPAETPRVPTTVTASGLIPSLMNRLMNGARATPCQKALNLSNMVRAG